MTVSSDASVSRSPARRDLEHGHQAGGGTSAGHRRGGTSAGHRRRGTSAGHRRGVWNYTIGGGNNGNTLIYQLLPRLALFSQLSCITAICILLVEKAAALLTTVRQRAV